MLVLIWNFLVNFVFGSLSNFLILNDDLISVIMPGHICPCGFTFRLHCRTFYWAIPIGKDCIHSIVCDFYSAVHVYW